MNEKGFGLAAELYWRLKILCHLTWYIANFMRALWRDPFSQNFRAEVRKFLSLVAISFRYHLWSNAAAKTKRKICETLVASFYSVWKSKKDLAGYGNNTNSEFAEFLLHRGNSISSPRDGNSNKRRREICLEIFSESNDGSSGSGSSKVLATFLAHSKLSLPLESSFQ